MFLFEFAIDSPNWKLGWNARNEVELVELTLTFFFFCFLFRIIYWNQIQYIEQKKRNNFPSANVSEFAFNFYSRSSFWCEYDNMVSFNFGLFYWFGLFCLCFCFLFFSFSLFCRFQNDSKNFRRLFCIAVTHINVWCQVNVWQCDFFVIFCCSFEVEKNKEQKKLHYILDNM